MPTLSGVADSAARAVAAEVVLLVGEAAERQIDLRLDRRQPRHQVEVGAPARAGDADEAGAHVDARMTVTVRHHGLMSQAVEDFPLDRLSSVQTKAGLATGDLTVHASGNSAVIKSIIKPDLKYLGDALRQHIGSGKPRPAPAPITPIDVADQLAKFAALRDQGVLTQEEFAAQKAKLLGLR
jgi:hypothetical protein